MRTGFVEKQSVNQHQSVPRMRKSDCTLVMVKMAMLMTKTTMSPGEQSLLSRHCSKCCKDVTHTATLGHQYHLFPFSQVGKLGTER